MKWYLTVGLLCVFFLGYWGDPWPAEVASPVPTAATYVGSEVCKACHAPQFEKFSETLMGKIFLHNPRNQTERHACENCHGAGSVHVAAVGGTRDNRELITFRKDSGESTRVQNEPCLQCHQRGEQTYWEASAHAGRGLVCVNCHTLMEKTTDRFQLAKVGDRTPFFHKRAETEICIQCHVQRGAQLMRTSHMPIREGKITCSDCHNPHGSPNPAQLRQASVNENCYSCHADRRGPFLWEHPPVLENCSNCHDPHGSVNDHLLKTRMPRLCTQCHNAVQHPATPRGPRSAFVFNRACTNCHSQVHGSNHPAGIRFQR